MAHRWAFSSVPNALNEKFLYDNKLRFGVCGDWLNGSRVEGAFMSGYHLSNKIFESLFPSESSPKSQL